MVKPSFALLYKGFLSFCGVTATLFLSFSLLDTVQAQVPSRADRSQSLFPPTANPLPKRLDPNVLLIDYCVPTGKTECHWTKANGKSFSYRFTVSESFCAKYLVNPTKTPLTLLVAPKGNFTIRCNGKELKTNKTQWLARSFNQVDLTGFFHEGDNEILLTADEAVPIFLTGAFQLASAQKGFIIEQDQQFLFPNSYTVETMDQLFQSRTGTPGPINDVNNPLKRPEMLWRLQGMPFYQGPVAYHVINEFPWSRTGDYFLRIPKFDDPEKGGSLYAAKFSIRINNRPAGFWTPKQGESGEFKVNTLLKSGTNDLTLTLYGDPELLFRVPNNPPAVMPSGKEYKIANFGLLEPFYLIQKIPAKN